MRNIPPIKRKKDLRQSNKGMALERKINRANEYYQKAGVGIIKKLPTPVHINSTHGNKVSGTLTKGELVDYIGMSNGVAVAFDAKETKRKSLPLTNIAAHQYRFLKEWSVNGGVSFLIMRFAKEEKTYVYPFDRIRYWYEEQTERKSIPLDDVEKHGEEIDNGTGILDYMKVVRKWI